MSTTPLFGSRPMTTYSGGNSRGLHPNYYLEDVFIEVEGQLFKLPRFLLEQSPVFRDMFSVPQGRECQEGRDLKNPIILHGYSAFDFTQLARVLIPRDNQPLTQDEWVSVLKLATMWELADIRARAITKLAQRGRHDPIFWVALAYQFDVKEWLVPAVNALARRDVPFEETDFARLRVLGDAEAVFAFVLKVGKVRDSFKPQPARPAKPNCTSPPTHYTRCPQHGHGYLVCCDVAVEDMRRQVPLPTRAKHDFTEEIVRVFDLPRTIMDRVTALMFTPPASPAPLSSGVGSIIFTVWVLAAIAVWGYMRNGMDESP